MTSLVDLGYVSLNVHANPCSNACTHCWTGGSAAAPRMPFEDIQAVLSQLVELGRAGPATGFFLLEEPTLNRRFTDILRFAADLGLITDEFFLPTNGSVLARASDATWEKLRSTGVEWLQLTLYGLEATHDEFAGRRGAFRDVCATAKRASEHGLRWSTGVVFHADNAAELPETIELARSLDPMGRNPVGAFIFSWQGRGRHASRPRAGHLAMLPEGGRSTRWVEERDAVEAVLSDPELSARRANEASCEALVLEVDPDLEVFCGGACDSGGIVGATPELRSAFLLGNLSRENIVTLVERYLDSPPWPMQRLAEMTWGELALRYGDRDNDELYHLPDLGLHKWASAHLREVS